MNERIKQLADQARKHFPKTESSGEFWVFDEAKFAELIVKECCDVLQTETIRHDGYGYNQGFLHKKIKEHFGVE